MLIGIGVLETRHSNMACATNLEDMSCFIIVLCTRADIHREEDLTPTMQHIPEEVGHLQHTIKVLNQLFAPSWQQYIWNSSFEYEQQDMTFSTGDYY